MPVAEERRTHHVRTFDLTVSSDRDDYEDLIGGETEGPIRVAKEMDFAMGGTGAIVRVVDFTKPPSAAKVGFAYEAPIC